MSGFYFAGDSGSISSADDDDNLPYPQALPRSDFLAPNFDAPTYLSTLSDRHQTLEDLRVDLRERSQALSKELLDLVNNNYEQFLSLGSDLRGGNEKVEDIRVGLLGFKRSVEDVRSKVWERSRKVNNFLDQKAQTSKQIRVGRKLLELNSRLEELEEKLMVSSLGRNGILDEDSWSESGDETEDEEDEYTTEEGTAGTSTKKLQGLGKDYQHVKYLTSTVGSHHPYVMAQEPRLVRVRNTLLLDLSTALKQAYHHKSPNLRLLKIMDIYREIDEGAEAIKVLKSLKGQ